VGLFGKKKALLASVSDEQLVDTMASRFGALGVAVDADRREQLATTVADAHEDLAELGILGLTLCKLQLSDLARDVLARSEVSGTSNVAAAIAIEAADQGSAELALDAVDLVERFDGEESIKLRMQVLWVLGRSEESLAILDRLVAEGSTWAAVGKGQQLLDLGDAQGAEEMFRRAADANEADGVWGMARVCFADGDRDDEGWRWVQRAAELGHERAYLMNGSRALHADDGADARVWFQRAIDEHESHHGMRELGVLDREAGDVDAAMELFHRAAELGNTDAMYDIGIHHEHGGDRVTAREWYQRGAELGDEDCMRAVGVVDMALGNEDEGVDELRKAAQRGDVESMVRLAQHLLARGEQVESRELMQRAADAGNSDAVAGLAYIAESDDDLEQANELYEQAARAGVEVAMYNRGNNARKAGDFDTARVWLAMGANAGFAPAAMLLGKLERGDFLIDLLSSRLGDDADYTDLLVDGEGPKDLAKAMAWFEKAGDLGEPAGYGFAASMALERGDESAAQRFIHLGLAASIGTFQLADVEELAAEWPGTYVIPPRELRERFQPGESVKLVWTDGSYTERMWALILKNDNDRYVGILDNDPIDMDIKQGTVVEFGPEHVLERPASDEERDRAMEELLADGARTRAVPDGYTREQFDALRERADDGDIDAMMQLVHFHNNGGNKEEVRQWLERAAALDFPAAIDLLGDTALEDEDMKSAIGHWTRAAVLGSTDAMYSLGWHANADGNTAEAEQWWRLGANAGGNSAMAALGAFLIETDTVEARVWLEKAVEAGVPQAMVSLSRLEYADGDEDHARTLLQLAAEVGSEEAADILEQFDDLRRAEQREADFANPEVVAHHEAALAGGDVESFWWLFRRAEFLEDSDQRLQVVRQGADIGMSAGMDLLGDHFASEDDHEQALQWWEKAAAIGNSDSMYSLGFAAFEAGESDDAAMWWERAMSHDHGGSALARARLAFQREEELATTFLRRASDLGNLEAQTLLGVHLLSEDHESEEGLRLIRAAAEAGHEEAIRLFQDGDDDD
jgi:TPR repeat protein